ncbi:hypothetical protein ORI20_27260 [Mycobacterium sp. CVI_P3]|uniref:Uncharacterized protein n=1 Tax=Mycobacterium pinniadriaticum TaxID=2994102 RepID=A0ABT3SLM6_9MYCO|nr:hypothetical protein [Mycobacterium pinniadriaticum]MCX2933973.1 hypothetical protein [Mycobacterium pinniadriaticum]MCX2940431.1 hypothetical protein [Mycobacterium pinniadriaticum]
MSLGQQGRYIGRVGALAVALGVGGFLAALPAVADADTGTGSSGKSTSSAGKHAPRNATKPGSHTPKPPTPKPVVAGAKSTPSARAAVKPSGVVSAASRVSLDRLGSGDDPLAPATEPLSWTVLAASRREGIAKSARSVASGTGTTSNATSSVPSASETVEAPLAAAARASSSLGDVVADFIDHYLPSFSPIADEVAPIVADGIEDLLNNGAVSAEVDRLVTNTAAMQFLSTKVSSALGYYFGVPPSVGAVVGNSAAEFVRTVLGDAGVQSALDVVAQAVMPTPEQYDVIAAGLAMDDFEPLGNYLKSLVPNSSAEITAFLSDPAVKAALSSATSDAVINLTNGLDVPTWLGDLTAGWVSSALGGDASATAVGDALGSAVQGLLSNSGAMQGLATVAGAAVTNILSSPGVPAAVADAITQFGTTVLAGSNWIDALDVAWQGLVADSAFRASLGPAAGSAVYSLATNSEVVSALAATATGLLNAVAANPDVQAILGELLGPTLGPTLVSTLADPESAAQLAATAGTVVTSFLGQPGVAAALAAAANQLVTALLAGYMPTDAVQIAFYSLQANPAVMDAWDATVPDVVRSALSAPAVQKVVGTVAQGLVSDLIDKTPFNSSALAPAVSQLTKATVDALLANPVAQDLIGDLAGDILNGTPSIDLVNTVVQSVLTSPSLQIALGKAVGEGIGALLGDNPIAFAVGQLAGVAAALMIGMVSGATLLFNPASATSVPSESSSLVMLRLDQLVAA